MIGLIVIDPCIFSEAEIVMATQNVVSTILGQGLELWIEIVHIAICRVHGI